jgi:hypothetical protein
VVNGELHYCLLDEIAGQLALSAILLHLHSAHYYWRADNGHWRGASAT